MYSSRLLHGERVYLDAIQRADIPQFAAWFADLEFLGYLSPRAVFPMTEDDETEWYERMRQSDNVTFAIRTRDEHLLIGNLGLNAIDWRSRWATFGIAVGDKNFWGQGYGPEATRLLLRYAFRELNLNRVELSVHSFNKRAIKSYEKCGFQHEGTRRQAVYRDSAYYDIHIMAILRSEWVAQQANT
ncbi:MAG: GNAT family N-acetyltransferase [Chloroflexi bacterium]|nr:GNAT family N-acetyltransferase [Chloroflexota bacterium]